MTRLIVLLSVMFVAVGCASSPSPSQKVASSATAQPHAQCLVCKYNADLACVDVTVDSQTPRCVCNGQTYYFCSDECKKAFEKNPSKYLSHGK